MQDEPYSQDPLSPQERAEYEDDLVVFCDGELDRLRAIQDLDVLYAGGASPLWLEGLSERIGVRGTLTALELDPERLNDAREGLRDAGLPAPVALVRGSVFEPPFEDESFDLVYSSGLFHELDVRERGVTEALEEMIRVVRPGGRVAASDFVDSVGAVQIEDERLEDEERREKSSEPFGIGPPERLVELFEEYFPRVRWDVAPPFHVRHLDGLVLAELSGATSEARVALRRRIRREGYTRPATLYVEGQRGGRR